MKKNVLILIGGGGTEHAISLKSAKYLQSQIDQNKFNLFVVEIREDKAWVLNQELVELSFNRELKAKNQNYIIDVVIPCVHGYPGETGDLQSYFELIGLPYFGCTSETNTICFNKLTTKLMLESFQIKTAPFITIHSKAELELAKDFITEHAICYLKATNQGSSVGCYKITNASELEHHVEEAFSLSPYVILEKAIKGKELEVAAFEYDNKIITTLPGEIECESDFYNFEEKYSKQSTTKTHIVSPNVEAEIAKEIKSQAKVIFEKLKLRHLARIDFFLTEKQEIIVNEINTFPGHTEISMFPMMLENTGLKYFDYINSHLETLVKN